MVTTSKMPEMCVTGRGSLVRPLYAPGLLLEADDLKAAVDHTSDLARLLLRSMLGCGVLCGLDIEATRICSDLKLRIRIGRGAAIDGHGNLIEVGSHEPFEIGDPCGKKLPEQLWLALRRREETCGKRELVCADDDGEATVVPIRVVDGFVLELLTSRPQCACGCDEPPLPPRPDDVAAPAPGAAPAQGADPAAVAPPAAGAPGVPAAEPQKPPYSTIDDPCYKRHYEGKCCNGECGGEGWVLLGRIDITPQSESDHRIKEAIVHHSVRRYVRPMLARDPKSAPMKAGLPD